MQYRQGKGIYKVEDKYPSFSNSKESIITANSLEDKEEEVKIVYISKITIEMLQDRYYKVPLQRQLINSGAILHITNQRCLFRGLIRCHGLCPVDAQETDWIVHEG